MRAISDVSFDIRRGEIRAIIGPNGAGKTSMLNVINGFYQPQLGKILFKGQARSRMRPHEAARQGIARTFQNVALFKGMTTLDNIMTGRNLQDVARPLLAGAAAWAGARRGNRAPQILRGDHRLSGDRGDPQDAGRQAALRPAEAGRTRPRARDGAELLLLDEPMAGMNREEKEDMSRFIVEANRRLGATIALIEHDIGVVMDLSDRVVVLEYGRKIADDVPDVVKADAKVISAYLGVSH